MRLYLRYHDGWNEKLTPICSRCDGFDQPGSYRRKTQIGSESSLRLPEEQ
jgi:hypothetical protein